MSYTLGEEGQGAVWKPRNEEEEVGWRALGQTGVTYSVPAVRAAASPELRRREEAGPGAPRAVAAAAAAGEGGSVVGAYDGLPKSGVHREKTIPNSLEINQVTHALCVSLPSPFRRLHTVAHALGDSVPFSLRLSTVSSASNPNWKRVAASDHPASSLSNCGSCRSSPPPPTRSNGKHVGAAFPRRS